MSATDTFGKLKARAEEADRIVRAAAEQNRAEVEQKLDEARRDADERATELRAKGQDAATEAKGHWQEMQADLDRHVKEVRQRIDATKATVDAKGGRQRRRLGRGQRDRRDRLCHERDRRGRVRHARRGTGTEERRRARGEYLLVALGPVPSVPPRPADGLLGAAFATNASDCGGQHTTPRRAKSELAFAARRVRPACSADPAMLGVSSRRGALVSNATRPGA